MHTKIVAEIGINHNGSLKIAEKLIRAASGAGCDYVKFQKRHIPLVYSQEELDKPRDSPWGTTTQQQKRGIEFDQYEYLQISKYCEEKGVGWFASVWDPYSAGLMADFNTEYVKVPSALITNIQLLEVVKEMPQKIIISTGMSTIEEVERCINFLGDRVEYVLACTSTYPCVREEINLNRIGTLKTLFPEFKIGFSNHSPGLTYLPAAVALGAEMVEFHITLDRSMYGSDQASSIEPHGVKKVVQQIRDIEAAMGDGKILPYESEMENLKKLRKNDYPNIEPMILEATFSQLRKNKEVA